MISRVRSKGWSLVEVMLVVGALMGVGALAYQANTRSVLASEVQLEQGNVKALSAAITESYGAVGTFANVSAIAMSNAGLAPMAMRSGTGLIHSWGAAVDLAPATFAAANDGFAITYNDVPAIACGHFVTASARGASDVTVNGASVMVSRNVVPTTLTTQCLAAANDIVFRYRAAHGAQISAPAIAAPAPDPSAPATPPCVGCPPAAIIPSVVPLAPPVGPSPVAPGAPVPGGALVPGSTTPCATTTDESRSVSCPAGQVGAKTERRSRACGAAVWGGWSTFYDGCKPVTTIPIVTPPPPAGTCYACPTGPGWVQNSNYNPAWPGSAVCGPGAPAWCVLPCAPTSSTQWVATAGACAAGFSGSRNWEREQLRNYTCPAAAWGAYADTGATRNLVDTCALTCVPNSQTQWLAVGAACPIGFSGANTWEKEQLRNYTCPAAAWGAYADTGATRNVVNTCAPTCTPSSQTVWTPTSGACPAGFVGSIDWEREQTRNYTCPAAAWGAYADTGATRNVVDRCMQNTCHYECDSPGETGNTCANGRVTSTTCTVDGANHPNGNFGGNRRASWGGYPAVFGQVACPAMATCDPIGAVCACTAACPLPQTESYSGTEDQCGMGDPSVWGGSAPVTYSRTRTASCSGGVVTWSAWSAYTAMSSSLGGCLCETRPITMGNPCAPLGPSGWRCDGEVFDRVCI